MIAVFLGIVLVVFAFEAFYYFQLKQARETRSDWYPEIKGDKIKYIDVGDLTVPQAQVVLEDIKEDLKKRK